MITLLTIQNLGFDFESPVYRFGALQTTSSNKLVIEGEKNDRHI